MSPGATQTITFAMKTKLAYFLDRQGHDKLMEQIIINMFTARRQAYFGLQAETTAVTAQLSFTTYGSNKNIMVSQTYLSKLKQITQTGFVLKLKFSGTEQSVYSNLNMNCCNFFLFFHHNPYFWIHIIFICCLKPFQSLFGRSQFFKFQFPFSNDYLFCFQLQPLFLYFPVFFGALFFLFSLLYGPLNLFFSYFLQTAKVFRR
jgi:hypothetical protein